MGLHEQVVKSNLNRDSSEIADFGVLFLHEGGNITYGRNLDVVLHLLVPINDDNFAVFSFLVFFSILFYFLLSLIVTRKQGGNDGGFISSIDFGAGGVEFVLSQFGIANGIEIDLGKGVLFIFASVSI